VELYLANKLIANVISSLVQFARYMSALIALRYGTFGLRISSSSFNGKKGYFFSSSDQTTIYVFKGLTLSM
jgi:hypothetical protein